MAQAAPATRRLAGIEAARGIAACAVVLYHASRHVDQAYGFASGRAALAFGHAGVDLFFVISGFIILFVHWEDVGRPARLAHYAGRRVTRVLPAYWVALALTILMAMAGGHRAPEVGQLAASALLLPSDTPPLLGVAWTLQYEIVFYAAFALLILHRGAGRAVFVLWAVAIVLAWAGWRMAALPGSLTGAYNVEFFLGLGIAAQLRRGALPAARTVLWVGILAFAICALAEDAGWIDGYADTARLLYGPAAAAVIAGLAEASRQGRLVPPALLRVLGSASYAIYLFQFVAIGLLWQVWLHAGIVPALPHALLAPIAFIVLSLGGIGGGVLASALVEKPLLRALRRAPHAQAA